MKRNHFMNQWLKLAFKLIKNKGLESSIRQNGHMSTHVFSHRDPASDLSLGHFIRIMINFAILCYHTDKRDEFMDYWISLGCEIRDFAESEDVEDFNRQFAIVTKQ